MGLEHAIEVSDRGEPRPSCYLFDGEIGVHQQLRGLLHSHQPQLLPKGLSGVPLEQLP